MSLPMITIFSNTRKKASVAWTSENNAVAVLPDWGQPLDSFIMHKKFALQLKLL